MGAASAGVSRQKLTIGTAASGTTGDIIAGVFLASDEDFKIGYTVTAAEVTGLIKSIDLRKNRLVAEDVRLTARPR